MQNLNISDLANASNLWFNIQQKNRWFYNINVPIQYVFLKLAKIKGFYNLVEENRFNIIKQVALAIDLSTILLILEALFLKILIEIGKIFKSCNAAYPIISL